MSEYKQKDIKIALLSILNFWIIMMIVILISHSFIRYKTKEQILNSIKTLTEGLSNSVNKNIEKRLNVLEVTANSLTEEDLKNPKETAEKLTEIVGKEHFEIMGIAFSDGTSYLNSGEIVNIKDRDYFNITLNGEEHVSYLVEAKIDSTKVNVYSVPVTKNNKVVAVLWASILTEDFFNNLDIEFLSDMGDIFIVDEEGQLIAGSDLSDNNFFEFIQSEANYKNNKDDLDSMIEDIENLNDNYKKFTYNNEKSYIYYTKINYNNWWLLTKVSEQKIKKMHNGMMDTVTGVSVILVVISSIGVYLIYNRGRKVNNYLKSIAYTDAITKGKNDIFLKEYLKKNMNKNRNFAFISLEIMNIKSIISILGFKNVYFILSNLYESISQVLEEKEIIVHSYLGEYKLLLEYKDIDKLIKKIQMIESLKTDKNLEIKMGIYLIEERGVEFEDMCGYTNIAKANIPLNENYTIYTKEMYQEEIEKIKLEEDIKYGIENKEFRAWFQPKYGKDGVSIIGAEALVRWYKYGTIISPYIFIPVCEARGFIKEIDEIVLEDVCKNLRSWIDQGKKVVPISVNLSRNYLDSHNLIERLERIINQYYIPKELIEFEITESSLVGNENKLKETMEALHDRGFKLLLDDFGMGYSSIKTIADMKFDVLKIDKSFIDGIGEEKWEDIIRYTISLSQTLNMDVLAEGIEAKEQYQFLLQCNCEKFQGYYFNKPMDVKVFSNLLSKELS